MVLTDDYYGRSKETFEWAEMDLAEPFVLTNQSWPKEMVGSDDKFSKFLQDFQAAFDISSYKMSVGRAQKTIDNEVVCQSVLSSFKSAIATADLKYPNESQDDAAGSTYKDLTKACSLSAFAMAAGSLSPPGFENTEVIR
jgi:hypothetical protein